MPSGFSHSMPSQGHTDPGLWWWQTVKGFHHQDQTKHRFFWLTSLILRGRKLIFMGSLMSKSVQWQSHYLLCQPAHHENNQKHHAAVCMSWFSNIKMQEAWEVVAFSCPPGKRIWEYLGRVHGKAVPGVETWPNHQPSKLKYFQQFPPSKIWTCASMVRRHHWDPCWELLLARGYYLCSLSTAPPFPAQRLNILKKKLSKMMTWGSCFPFFHVFKWTLGWFGYSLALTPCNLMALTLKLPWTLVSSSIRLL